MADSLPKFRENEIPCTSDCPLKADDLLIGSVPGTVIYKNDLKWNLAFRKDFLYCLEGCLYHGFFVIRRNDHRKRFIGRIHNIPLFLIGYSNSIRKKKKKCNVILGKEKLAGLKEQEQSSIIVNV